MIFVYVAALFGILKGFKKIDRATPFKGTSCLFLQRPTGHDSLLIHCVKKTTEIY